MVFHFSMNTIQLGHDIILLLRSAIINGSFVFFCIKKYFNWSHTHTHIDY